MSSTTRKQKPLLPGENKINLKWVSKGNSSNKNWRKTNRERV